MKMFNSKNRGIKLNSFTGLFVILALKGIRLYLVILLVVIILLLAIYIIYLYIRNNSNSGEKPKDSVAEATKVEVVETTDEVMEVVETPTEVVEPPLETKVVEALVENEEPVVKEENNATSDVAEATRLNYSLEAYIQLAPEESLQRYLDIKNYILSYPDIKISDSWKFERFKYGARTFAKITLQGKTLRIYFDINPNEFTDTVYNIKDESSKNNHVLTPSMLIVKGNRGVKHAKEIIDFYFGKLFVKNTTPVETVLPVYNKTKEDLIEEGLIKVKKVKETF